jgi:hypothetical protein
MFDGGGGGGDDVGRHSGAMRSIKPGIHRTAGQGVEWIPGSTLRVAPE